MMPICASVLVAVIGFSPALADEYVVRSGSGDIFTIEQVGSHRSPSDCWMSFDGKVYNVSRFVKQHDDFLDIRRWCGKDMSFDFRTKGRSWQDHRPKTYAKLEKYRIGELDSDGKARTAILRDQVSLTTGGGATSRYSIWIPMSLTLAALFGHRLLEKWLAKRGQGTYLLFNKMTSHKMWNVALLLASVPALVLGSLLTLKQLIPELDLDTAETLEWHVSGSLVFVILAVAHVTRHWRSFIPKWVTALRKRAGMSLK